MIQARIPQAILDALPASPIADHTNEIVTLVVWVLATVATIAGYAQIARSKGVSGWRGLLGAFSLRSRDPRPRP